MPAPGFAAVSLADGAKAVHVQLMSADSGIGGTRCASAQDASARAEAAGAPVHGAAPGGAGAPVAPDLTDRSTFFPLPS